MNSATDEYEWHNNLPHPRWRLFFESIDSLPISEKGALTTNFVSRWLRDLAGALGSQAGVVLNEDMFCLYSSMHDQPERLLRWSSNALARIISIVGDHRTPEMYGPRIVMLFSDLDRYYDYVDKFYPASGEFGASAGLCIAHDYFHVIVGPGGFGTRQGVLAHELTHFALGPLALPLWLNEGLAQMMQEVLLRIPRFRIDREFGTTP
jgi:hypothetical protein